MNKMMIKKRKLKNERNKRRERRRILLFHTFATTKTHGLETLVVYVA